MKNFYTLVTLLFVGFVNGQNNFNNIYKYFSLNVFTEYPVSGGGGVLIQIQDNILTVNFSAGFDPVYLKEGEILNNQDIQSNPAIPSMDLGYVTITSADGTSYSDRLRAWFEYPSTLILDNTRPDVSYTNISGSFTVDLTNVDLSEECSLINNLEVSEALTETYTSLHALHSVKLLPGFKSNNNYFSAKIVDNLCSQPPPDDTSGDQFIDYLLNLSCNQSVSTIQEPTVTDTYIEDLCFNFDAAGNQEEHHLCSSSSGRSAPTDNSLEEIANQIYVAPNPTNSVVTISWEGEISNLIARIQVVPINGAFVIPVNFSSASNSSTINLRSYNSGLYVARFILNSGQVVTKKIIKI